MSSLLAHMAIGATIYLARRERPSLKVGAGISACVLLAVLPDIDYFAWWVLRIQIEPRITHSLVFCAASAVAAWALLRFFHGQEGGLPSILTLLLAACSHLALDYMVGVHTLPLLWPIGQTDFVAPFGVLPSAGRLDIGNFYLWRNLLIELGVVFPVLAALIAVGRRECARITSSRILLILPVWVAFLCWSVSLQR